MQEAESIMERIERDIAAMPRPLVVGVSGAYTAGKTTFAEALAVYLRAGGNKVQIVHYDDFHYPLQDIQWTVGADAEVNAFYASAFNHGKLVAELLAPMRAAGSFHETLFCLDWGAGRYTKRGSL